MAHILFEQGKKIGQISNWAVTPDVPVEKNILGKKVLLPPGKDTCTFISPKPIRRKAQLTVIENDQCEFSLDVKSVQNTNMVTAEIVSRRNLSKK